MKLSLCIISRKEDEESLLKALGSCSQYVDEVIIVDTTNGDNKLAVDRKPGESMSSDYGMIRWFPFTWTGSFADARNFSFSKAKGDVLLWLDSDDKILHPENLRPLAEKIMKGECDWIYLDYLYSKDEYGNVNARHWKPRLIRAGTSKWVGRVHEDLQPLEVVVQKRDIDLGKLRVVIEHQMTLEHAKESAERNLSIQLREIEEDGEKVDARTLQYAGMSLQALERYEEAIPLFLAHFKASGSVEDKFWSLQRVCQCNRFLGKHEEAESAALSSLKLFPQWNTGYYNLAEVYFNQAKWDKVVEWTLAGRQKDNPDTLQVISDLDLGILPFNRLAFSYLNLQMYDEAKQITMESLRISSTFPATLELKSMITEAMDLEEYVQSFLKVAGKIKEHDRVKAVELFGLVPKELDDDLRIQQARKLLVPPKVWPSKSIVIFCGNSLEEWAYPSKFVGIGGSEKAVINMSEELVSKGYSVTVYNRCGDMKGEYNGVTYLPYYYFNPRDTFDVLIGWRNPGLFTEAYKARRKYLWLHDIAYPEYFNETIYKNVDKVLFLSQWHRTNLPDCPDDKVYITNNGIDPKDFEGLPEKRPNSLIWSSSYDRGLLPFLKNIYPLIQKEIPDVTIDICYGWQNIEKEMELIPSLKQLYTELSPLLETTPGVTHHGRISHRKLAKLMGECMVYPYASEFGETNNMTSQECQEADCFVVVSSECGGTPERVRYGTVVETNGIYTDPKSQRAFADAVIVALRSPKTPTEDLSDFYWSTTVNNWIKDIL